MMVNAVVCLVFFFLSAARLELLAFFPSSCHYDHWLSFFPYFFSLSLLYVRRAPPLFCSCYEFIQPSFSSPFFSSRTLLFLHFPEFYPSSCTYGCGSSPPSPPFRLFWDRSRTPFFSSFSLLAVCTIVTFLFFFFFFFFPRFLFPEKILGF